MLVACQLDEGGAGNLLRSPACAFNRQMIAGSMEDEGRHRDRGQHVANVDLLIDSLDLPVRVRACAQPLATREMLGLLLARLGEPFSRLLDRPPTAHVVLQLTIPLGPRPPPGEIGSPLEARERAVYHERGDSTWVCRREQQAHGTALRDADHRRPAGAGRVHHRPYIVDPRLQVTHSDRVGRSGAALVEDDQSAERRQPLEVAGTRWVVPDQIDMRNRAWDVDDVEGTLSQDLVRDVDIATPRVPGLRYLHAPGVTVR